MIQLIDKIWKEKSPTKKIRGWMYGVTSFVLMLVAIGCTPTSKNTDIPANGMEIDCDVYKVGHHGSKTASCQEFLKAITPTYAIISCAQGNSYGHPHAETLNNLRSMGAKVFRTDEQGSIVAYSNGIEITWNCVPSDTWQAGEPEE